MKVTVNIERMDLLRFGLSLLPRMRATYVTLLVMVLLAFAYICWRHGFPQSGRNWVAALTGSLAGGISGLLIGVTCSIISSQIMSSSRNGVLGEHEYTLTEEGLHERTSANEGISKWNGITKVMVVGSYLLFQISGYLYHIVPKRSFGSAEDFGLYVSASMKHWQNAHNGRVDWEGGSKA